jgi:hypothetical protein
MLPKKRLHKTVRQSPNSNTLGYPAFFSLPYPARTFMFSNHKLF